MRAVRLSSQRAPPQDAFATGHEIVCNQVELHVGFPQTQLRHFCAEHEIAVTAYSPLGRGNTLELELVQTLAEKYTVTPGQVAINWLLEIGLIAIPKSAKAERIKENFAAQQFTMDQADIDALTALTNGERLIDPDFGDFDY